MDLLGDYHHSSNSIANLWTLMFLKLGTFLMLLLFFVIRLRLPTTNRVDNVFLSLVLSDSTINFDLLK